MNKACGIFISAVLTVAQLAVRAAEPVVSPYVVLGSINGSMDTLRVGESGTLGFEAPLELGMRLDVEKDADTRIFSQWRVERVYMDGGEEQRESYLLRQTDTADYTITDWGTFTIHYAYSFKPGLEQQPVAGAEIAPVTFSIDDSDLQVPNAFSPNGDGINDLFKIKVHSIVSLKISIFTRWGELVKSATQDELLYEGDTQDGFYVCWDGTHSGRMAEDGVYYIRIEAVGAGGRKYTKRSDINLLKGLDIK